MKVTTLLVTMLKKNQAAILQSDKENDSLHVITLATKKPGHLSPSQFYYDIERFFLAKISI